jgi:CheY-like chemotaxis protein
MTFRLYQLKTILVVEDDYLLVEALTDLLELEGYRVVSAANGKDGLAQLVKESPDMVLTDFMMPVADGLDLIWGVHALPKFRALPMIMMSVSPERVALPARPLRALAFLSKPFGLDELLPIIERLIGRGEPGKV